MAKLPPTRIWTVYIESPGKRSFVKNKMLCGKTIEFFHQKTPLKLLVSLTCGWLVGWLVGWSVTKQTHSITYLLLLWQNMGRSYTYGSSKYFVITVVLVGKSLTNLKKSQQGRFSVKKVTEKSNPTNVWFDQTQAKSSGTPKSSILIGFSIANHAFWDTPIFWKHPTDPIALPTLSSEICSRIHLAVGSGDTGGRLDQ